MPDASRASVRDASWDFDSLANTRSVLVGKESTLISTRCACSFREGGTPSAPRKIRKQACCNKRREVKKRCEVMKPRRVQGHGQYRTSSFKRIWHPFTEARSLPVRPKQLQLSEGPKMSAPYMQYLKLNVHVRPKAFHPQLTHSLASAIWSVIVPLS